MFEKTRTIERKNPVTQQAEIIDQEKANRKAIGHFKPYRTHYLDSTSNSAEGKEPTLEEDIQQFARVSKSWELDEPRSNIEFEGSELKRTDQSAGRNPYMIINVNQNLIENHNDLDDPRIANFVRQLILVSGKNRDPLERSRVCSRAIDVN